MVRNSDHQRKVNRNMDHMERTTTPVHDHYLQFDGGRAVFIRTVLETLVEAEGEPVSWKGALRAAIDMCEEAGFFPTDNQVSAFGRDARWTNRMIKLSERDGTKPYTATLTTNPKFVKQLNRLLASDWGIVDDDE